MHRPAAQPSAAAGRAPGPGAGATPLIRAVTFDFWNTLYVEGPARLRRQRLREDYARGFLLGLGHSVSDSQLGYALRILAHELEDLWRTRHVSLPTHEVGQRLARIVAANLDEDDGRRLGELVSSAAREEPPVPADGALDLLAALHGRAKLAVISDTGLTSGTDLYAVMEADGVAQLMDHFTFSDQTGTTKPETRQFLYTLHRLGCDPHQAVHVGDLEHSDVTGGRQAGMRTIPLVHPGSDGASAADATVGSLAGVLDVLREWGADC